MAMKEELMESFKVFDQDRLGSIGLAEMRFYLRTYGVAMSEEEVEEMLKECEPEDGSIKYEKFIDKILDRP
jgi:Ca2+-binding EF-hand superfamily protein